MSESKWFLFFSAFRHI